MTQSFIRIQPQPEDYWRSIVMFGRNVASYKFALGRALLDLAPAGGQVVTLEEIAEPYSQHICTHLRTADKQATSPGSRFLDACRRANRGEISQAELISQTVTLGFNDVIPAFHVVGRGEIPSRFFDDVRASESGIRITDTFARLVSSNQFGNLAEETEARWRLVETSWELGVSRNLVAVSHDASTGNLFALDHRYRRKPITGARQALSGYQKGHCFYCFDSFSLLGKRPPDVDHFFPHTLKSALDGPNLDGVWNLVLACPGCNRGSGGKSDSIPTLSLLERLSTRNEFLISSHHPLRETLMAQTGRSEGERRRFLNRCHSVAVSVLIHEWEPETVRAPLF